MARVAFTNEKEATGKEPVSYTHLDVYKRQVHMRSQIIIWKQNARRQKA